MTFEERRKYHRSFRYTPPRNPIFYKPVPPPYEPPQRAPRCGCRPDARPRPVCGTKSLLDPINLQPIWIDEKPDQEFSKYATCWELVWSRLSIGWTPWRFIPIVDHDIMVVAYCGVVRGKELVFINDGAHGNRDQSLDRLLELGPVYVGTEQFYKENGKANYTPVESTSHTESGYGVSEYAVQTDIDGQVMAAEFVREIGRPEAESVDFSLLTWLSLGRSLIKLGLRVLVTEARSKVVDQSSVASGLRAQAPALPSGSIVKTFIREGDCAFSPWYTTMRFWPFPQIQLAASGVRREVLEGWSPCRGSGGNVWKGRGPDRGSAVTVLSRGLQSHRQPLCRRS